MREFLVTKFVCAACGSNLELATEMPKTSRYSEGQPSGAFMLEQLVSVKPCQKCMKPLDGMRQAMKTLMEGIAP